MLVGSSSITIQASQNNNHRIGWLLPKRCCRAAKARYPAQFFFCFIFFPQPSPASHERRLFYDDICMAAYYPLCYSAVVALEMFHVHWPLIESESRHLRNVFFSFPPSFTLHHLAIRMTFLTLSGHSRLFDDNVHTHGNTVAVILTNCPKFVPLPQSFFFFFF